MLNRLDWSEWILQKNNQVKQEELLKGESVFIDSEESLEKGKIGSRLPFQHGSTIHLNRAVSGNAYEIHEVTPDNETIVHPFIPYGSLDRAMDAGKEDSAVPAGRLRIGGEYLTDEASNHDRYWSAKVHQRPWRSETGARGFRLMLVPEGEPHTLAGQGTPKIVKNEDPVIEKATKDMAGDNVDSSMLMSELESLEHHIKEIKEHLSSSEIAPDWVKAKVSKSASHISDIAHYIMGFKERK
jgi:hypothetical protein